MFKIVIFWGKEKGPVLSKNPLPLKDIGYKRPVYMQLLDELSKIAEVYLVFGYVNSLGDLKFKNPVSYNTGEFKLLKGKRITADAVYDRSGNTSFPENDDLFNAKTVNCSDFKILSNNKWEFYKKFTKNCPATYLAEDRFDYKKIISELEPEKRFVAKPVNGMQGKGIYIDFPDNLKKVEIDKPYLVQQFLDTSGGIDGLVSGRHDLRLVVIDRKIVWATVRTPSDSEILLANVALGGEIKEVEISKIPKRASEIALGLADAFYVKYNNPLFSVDFGFEKGKPYIFEINDQIGFPGPKMKKNIFVSSLVELLLKKARIDKK